MCEIIIKSLGIWYLKLKEIIYYSISSICISDIRKLKKLQITKNISLFFEQCTRMIYVRKRYSTVK